ncbi:MAG: CDP-diacylglycerol--serine O-phosphatidyltransferase [Firmicutes bacterium]|nr:CDP-diacylglycerol--serine O-phosphatidyltransferase [Bacillota bacterium]
MSRDHKEIPATGWFIKNLPNLMTLLNMLSGLTVLYLSIGMGGQNYAGLSCLLIIVAVVVDVFDGALARWLGTESDLGKQLDSFADLISFGLAPIAVLLTVEPIGATPALLPILAFYPVAGAFRLARFNLGDYTAYFVGLPITAAGLIQACFLLLLNRIILPARWAVASVALLTAALSLLMVSTFKINKVKVDGRNKR